MVIEYKCPGAALNRNVRVEIKKCPSCSYEVEIFEDESAIKCPKCGTEVRRQSAPSCVSWCKHARKCLGEKKWNELIKDMKKRQQK